MKMPVPALMTTTYIWSVTPSLAAYASALAFFQSVAQSEVRTHARSDTDAHARTNGMNGSCKFYRAVRKSRRGGAVNRRSVSVHKSLRSSV